MWIDYFSLAERLLYMNLFFAFMGRAAGRSRFANLLLFPFLAGTFFLFFSPQNKPVLYIIGDSTVRNGNGTGADSLWGWGSLISPWFDTSRISIDNRALGGRSSRTFITEGRWERIMQTLRPGDFVIMQFGHNDASPLDDTARARGTLKGTGSEEQEIYNPIRKQQETVHTYGWYMRRYVNDAKSKGAIAIICSPVPRDNWKNGKVMRADSSYGRWARQVAEETGAFFIDLNMAIADRYEQLGQDRVKLFFPKDHTHPDKKGSELNAAIVIDGIRQLERCDLKKYLNQ